MNAETWGGTRAAAELSENCAGNKLESFRSITENGGKQQSPGKRIARLLRQNCAAATLLLAACQTPAVQTRTVEVKVPVAVQPIKPAQVPAVPAPLGPRPQSLSAAADQLLAKHCEFVAYAILADPLLRVSAGQPPAVLPKYPECEKP